MYTVNDILSIDQLKNVQLKNGIKGLNREIKTVTIMDIPEIIDWVNAGELIIAGVLFERYFSKAMVDEFMDKGIAGIVTKEKFTTTIDDNVFRYCDDIGFPVILVPAYYSWAQIITPIFNDIIHKPYQVIEENQKLHFILIHSMIHGVSLSEISAKFYETTQISHAILDSDFHIIGSSDNYYWKKYIKKIDTGKLSPANAYMQNTDNSVVQTYCYNLNIHNGTNQTFFFYPIILDHVKYGYIVTTQNKNAVKVQSNEIIKIQQLGLFIALHIVKLRGIRDATRRFNCLLLNQLLVEEMLLPERAEELLVLTGKKIHSQYYIVHIIYKNSASLVSQNNQLSRFHDMFEKQIKNSEHIIVFEQNNAQILLIPYPNDDIDELLMSIRALFIATTQFSSVYIGVSEPTPLRFIKKAFLQSKRVVHFLISIGSHAPYYKYSDLGILKFFIETKNKLSDDFIKELYDTIIAPLIAYDNGHNTRLLHTLITYIENDCSKTKTRKALFIHKNTLIARFNVINKVLNCNLNSTEDFFNIQLALKIHQAMLMAKIT